MSKALGLSMAVVGLALFGLAMVQLATPAASAADATITEGLPIYWSCTIEAGGLSEIVCRSGPFAISSSDDPWLMCGDAPDDIENEFVGDMGVFGSMTWYRVPEGYTLSIFPGHVPEGVTPIKPPLFDLVEEYAAQHPAFYKLSEGQFVMKLRDDGQITPAALSSSGKQYYQYYPEPEPGCESMVQNPYVLEYRVTIVGDVSDLVIPSPTMSYIYRVIKPAN